MPKRNRGLIFLGGGGDIHQTLSLDVMFFSKIGPKARILYIQSAMPADSDTVDSCRDWFSRLVSAHAADKDIVFDLVTENDIPPELGKYAAVYLGGGNTYKLLEYLVKNGLEESLTEYLRQGGIVYGGSAGAIVLGKDIRTVQEENDAGSLCHEGLNLLEDQSVRCHYSDSDLDLLKRLPSDLGHPVIALTEESGMYLGENQAACLGLVIRFLP